jgi:hypothetical protein
MSHIKVCIDWPIYTTNPDGSEVETVYEIECDLTPYDPGRTYGPPEKCYPPEGGDCEILSVKLLGVEVKDWEKFIDKDMEEAIAERAGEAAPGPDDDPPDPRED